MSIKIEGGDGTAENVIKAGTSNELLYNDKEVLLKEGFVGLDLSLLPPDLKKAEEWKLATWDDNDKIWINKPFTVPEDGWIVGVDLKYRWNYDEVTDSYFINIDGIGALEMTPGQYYIDSEFLRADSYTEHKPVVIYNLNCPYPVKKGQVISSGKQLDTNNKYNVIVTFAPCMSV